MGSLVATRGTIPEVRSSLTAIPLALCSTDKPFVLARTDGLHGGLTYWGKRKPRWKIVLGEHFCGAPPAFRPLLFVCVPHLRGDLRLRARGGFVPGSRPVSRNSNRQRWARGRRVRAQGAPRLRSTPGSRSRAFWDSAVRLPMRRAIC